MNDFEKGQALSKKLLDGINKLADPVASTLGAKGRNVLLACKGCGDDPIVTKDGVTVANAINLEDAFEDMGAQIAKQAAKATHESAGDGTTTATVLTRAMFKNAQKYIASGASPVEVKRGMDKATQAIVSRLVSLSQPISSAEDIEHIARISANNDKAIGKLIATAIDQAGKDGSVLIEEAGSLKTSLELIEGFRFKSGYLSSSFVTNERNNTVEYQDPYILVTDEKIEFVDQIIGCLEQVARDNRPLLIISTECENQALAALIMNAIKGTMKVCAVKAPEYGEERRGLLRDLALTLGATFVTKEDGHNIKDVTLKHLGQAKKIYIDKNFSTIVGGKGDPDLVDQKIETLKAELKQTEGLVPQQMVQDRITRLASGVAVIRVGAASEVEMIEKKHRIDDALEAVRSAQEEGILPGGGVALIRCSKGVTVETDNDDQAIGVKIVIDSIQAPLRQMALNAGQSPDIIVEAVTSCEGNEGYDFMQDKIVDMYDSGIVDPAKVTRCALENANSVAGTLLTTGHAIHLDAERY
jgi:chaperonin GroEL